MKITIVYQSMFGTPTKSRGTGDGVRKAHPDADVECVAVGNASAELIKTTDLLVVGGADQYSPDDDRLEPQDGDQRRREGRSQRRALAHELETDAEGPGLREWFDHLPKAREGDKAAAFDTRLGSALAGGAAYGIVHRLHKHGYYLVKNPEGFVVDEAHGPLRTGEIERAKEWGTQLVRASVSTTTTPVPTQSKGNKTPVRSGGNKAPAVPTWWPRDLRDLSSDWGPTGWPFLNAEEFIKVEEFIKGDHLVIRVLSCQGSTEIVTSTCPSTTASSPSRRAREAIGEASR